jgi:Plastocyanin-like domain
LFNEFTVCYLFNAFFISVVFEYNKDYHNVMLVTKNDYKSCNGTNPIAKYDSGNDSFSITRAGHIFFICGVPGHCAAGQKINIRIEKTKAAPSPHFAPVPNSGSPSSSSGTDTGDDASMGTAAAPAPKPSSGSRFTQAYFGSVVSLLATMASLVV